MSLYILRIIPVLSCKRHELIHYRELYRCIPRCRGEAKAFATFKRRKHSLAPAALSRKAWDGNTSLCNLIRRTATEFLMRGLGNSLSLSLSLSLSPCLLPCLDLASCLYSQREKFCALLQTYSKTISINI